MNRVVFLDNDGTLIEPVSHSHPTQIRLIPSARRAVMRLVREGYSIAVIANQSAIAHGQLPEAAMGAIRDRLVELFAPMGARLAGFYYCPHHPEGTVAEFAIACECRKPAAGLILRAAEELGVDPAGSWMVGDTLDDVEAGNRAGCRTILLDNGHETEWRAGGDRWPTAVVEDLDRAMAIVLRVDEPARVERAP